MLKNLLARLVHALTPTTHERRPKRWLPLGIESLEDRTVPTVTQPPVPTLPPTPNGGAWVKIDTITVATKTNSTPALGVQSNVVLDSGVTYLAVASGTARIATDTTGFTDAEFIRYNKSTGPQDGSSPGYAWNNHGVRLDGVDGGNTTGNFWGAYQADHTYTREVTGQGTLLRGWYSDIPGYYGDNSGTLQVDIYAEVPEGTGIIAGIVWQDEVTGTTLPGNGDGIRQDYEPFVHGVEIELLDQAGDVVATAASDSSGAYRFEGIPLGEYRVRFVLPTDARFTLANQGSNESRDSDADPSTGFATDSIVLTAAQPAQPKINAGVIVIRLAPVAPQSTAEGAIVAPFPVGVVNAKANEFDWSATGLPPGVTISPVTGEIFSQKGISYSAAPANETTEYTVNVTATEKGNPNGAAVSGTFKWKVADSNPLQAIDDQLNKLLDPVALTPGVVSPDALTPGYTITFTSLPTGVTSADNSATGKTMATAMAQIVTATIVNANQTHTRQFYWTVRDATGPRIEGPAVVPGNSTYQYKVYWDADISRVDPKDVGVSLTSGLGGGGKDNYTLVSATSELVDGKSVWTETISFSNKAPAKLVMRARLGNIQVAALPITIVQTFIRDPNQPEEGIIPKPFERGPVLEDVRGGLGGPPATKGVYALGIRAGKSLGQGLVKPPGLIWRGNYGVVGPNGGQGVSRIRLGFIQHIGFETAEATYADGTTLIVNYDGKPVTGQSFLDKRADAAEPWYRNASFTPSATKTSDSFDLDDSPIAYFPLSSDQAKIVDGAVPVIPAARALTSTRLTEKFTLDFAACTLDPFGADSTGGIQYFVGARAVWSFLGNGTIAANGNWVANPAMPVGAVESPNSWAGLAPITAPILVDTKGVVANSIGDKLTFTAK